jgi:transposase-like protein
MPRPPSKRGVQAARRQQMKSMYESGMKLRDIAGVMNVTYQCVHQVLVRMGVTMRPRGGNTGSHSRHRK